MSDTDTSTKVTIVHTNLQGNDISLASNFYIEHQKIASIYLSVLITHVRSFSGLDTSGHEQVHPLCHGPSLLHLWRAHLICCDLKLLGAFDHYFPYILKLQLAPFIWVLHQRLHDTIVSYSC